MEWSDLVVGVIAGVVATVLWAAGSWLHRRRRLRRDFSGLRGRFAIFRKLDEDPRPESARIEVSGSLLRVVFEGLPPEDSVAGEIVMNEQLPRSGRGHYGHVKNGERLWGIWDVQVQDADTILVHTTYAHPSEHRAVVSGFVWRALPD